MSKKIKSPRRSILSNAEPWVRDLQTKVINTNAFNCSISILVESKPFYRKLACEFDKYCQYGYRNCIKCISVDKIIETLFTNCSKNGEMSPLAALCDEIMKYIGKYFKGTIPNDLYKYLIKYIILDYKERRIREKWISAQSELEFQNKLKPYLTKTSPDKPSTKGAKTDGKKGNETKGTKNQPTSSDKLNTQLHKRNENMKCLEDVHDEPEGGPDLYIILIQSQNSDLPLELMELDIPIKNIIQMGHIDTPSFDDDAAFRQILEQNKEKNDDIDKLLKMSYLGNECKESFLKEDDIRCYLSKILYFMNRKQHSDDFEGVVTLKYIPTIPEEPKSPDFIDKLRRNVYDGISKTVFESYILRKMHQEYIQNAKLLDVDSQTEKKLEDLQYYLKVMNNIPQLSASVELITDTIITQVCNDLDSSDSDSNRNLIFTNNKKNESKESVKNTCIEKLIINLGKSNQFNRVSIKKDDTTINNDINIFCHGDQLSENMAQHNKKVADFIKSRTLFIYKLFWDYITWSRMEKHKSLIAYYKIILEETFSDPLKSELVDLLICLIQLEKETNEEINDQYLYQQDVYFNDHYLEYFKDIFKKVCSNEKANTMSEQYSIFYPILMEVNFQKLQNIFRESTHYKFQHIALNDKLIITFYDKRIPLIKREELPTILSLRDFIEDISKDNRLEASRILNNKEKYNYSDLLKQKINPLIKEDINEEEPNETKEIVCSPLKYHGHNEDWIISDYDVVYENRNKYKFLFKDREKNMETERDNAVKPVLYNLGVQGKISLNYFDLNIKINKDVEVFLKYWDMPRHERYHLNITAKLKNHDIHYNTNTLPEGFYLEPFDMRNAYLHIEHESGMIFSINKIKSEPIINNSDNNVKDFPKLNFLKFNNNVDESDLNFFKDKKLYTYELNISWPTGLTIKQINTDNITYIKQKYISQKPNMRNNYNLNTESHRCILNNGSVIKFMTNDSVIILFGNGGMINCTKFQYDKSDESNNKFRSESSDKHTSEEFEINNLKMVDYQLRQSDGKLFTAVDGILKEQESLFVEDINNILKCSITTEFSDGVLYEHKSDCSLTVQFLDGTNIISYSRFADNEILIDIPEIESKPPKIIKEKLSETKKKSIRAPRIEKKQEPFTVVEMTYKIDHPCFACVVLNYPRDAFVLAMPEKTQLTLTNNIHINFKEEIQIFNYRTSVIVQQVVKDKVKNEFLFSFENFRKRNENDKLDPCVIVKDDENNSILIYDNGKFEIKDTLKGNTNQHQQLFVIDRNFKGFKILSKYDMNKQISSIMKEKSVLRQIRKEHFIDNLVLTPILKLEKWTYFYDFINVEPPIKYPSTYGKYWYFPFKEKPDCNNSLEAIIIRDFNEIKDIKELFVEMKKMLFHLISNYKSELFVQWGNDTTSHIFNQLFQQLENILKNKEFTLNEYNKGSVQLENECEKRESKQFIKKIVLYKTDQGIYQSNINSIKKRFDDDKLNILNKRILPYFENGEGLAFLLVKEIADAQLKVETDKRERRELQELIMKPLRDVDSDDLARIKELAIKVNHFKLADDKEAIISLQKILEAGKKLENYFANIDEVLCFHQTAKEGISEDYCYT